MPARDFEGVFYVGKVPSIQYRDEAFHICYEIGRCRFEFALPPNIFNKAMLLATEAIAEWRVDGMDRQNVTKIGRKK
jgi:hypothetical protein